MQKIYREISSKIEENDRRVFNAIQVRTNSLGSKFDISWSKLGNRMGFIHDGIRLEILRALYEGK